MPLEHALRQFVDAWLRRADGDLRNIELVLPAKDAPLETVAFHAQQAGEKALKALLTARGIPVPKIHDLEELAAKLPASDRLALDVKADDLAMLSQLGVAPRYPGWDDTTDLATVTHAADIGRHLVRRAPAILAQE